MKTLGIVCAGLLAACEAGAADSAVELLSVAQDAATKNVTVTYRLTEIGRAHV